MLSTSWKFGIVKDDLRSLRASCGFSDAVEDEKSLHLLAKEDGQPIACGSLFFDDGAYRIARISVLPEKRNQGVGDLVTRVLLMRAFSMMADRVVLGQVSSKTAGYFARYGFHSVKNNEWEVTPDTLTFSSKCGHDCSSCVLQKSCRS